MSKTLEQLRADLARDVGLFLTGVATGGLVGTLVDNQGFKHLVDNDALNNGMVYIRTDFGGAHAAPEGESRRISDYVAGTWTLSVDVNWTVAPGAGDIYEIYRVPLTLAMWNQAINKAILEAWPEVWERNLYEVASTGVDSYVLPAAAQSVEAAQVYFTGALAGWPAQPLPRGVWQEQGTPGTDLYLNLTSVIPATGRSLRVFYKTRYAELVALGSTELDYSYLMAAAKANLYEVLAGETGGQTDRSAYLQLLNYWRGEARLIKAALANALAGGSGVAAAPKGGK